MQGKLRAFGQRRPHVASTAIRLASHGNVHAVLRSQRISLLVSSRQSSKLCLVTAGVSDVQLVHWDVLGPMGLFVQDSMLCVGWAEGIKAFHSTGTTDDGSVIYTESGDYRTGPVSIHDVGIDDAGKIWFLNTAFSALCSLKPGVNFAVEWTPDFTGAIGPYDYCHLNGMDFADGRPRYYTALAASSTPQGWRDNVLQRGILMTGDGAILADGLSLPHSPKQVEEGVLLLEAGNGRVSHVNPATSTYTTRAELPGVLRGADTHHGTLFVGASKVRESSGVVAEAMTSHIQVIDHCRINLMDIATGVVSGHVELPVLEEISTIAVLPAPGLCFERMLAPGEPFTYLVET